MTISSTAPTKVTAAQRLDLTEELILVLLSEESGYFHQVPGWHLNCAMAGAALAELSLQARIDTDMESLILLDKTPTGKPILDLALQQIASEPEQRSAQYWVERLAPRAEMMLDLALEQLVRLGILEHHDGEFWSLTAAARHSDFFAGDDDDTAVQFIKTRIGRSILLGEIPSPRDVIIIGLAHTCDVLRFIFELDDEAEERVQLICQMDLIGRAIADAVAHNLVASLLRSSALTKSVPKLPLNKLLLNRHFLRGNIPAVYAQLTEEFGPVFRLSPLFSKQEITFLSGPRVNRWVHRHGRMHLRSSDYLRGLETAYHASGLLPALDGADHFRMRKALRGGYGRARFEQQLETVYQHARTYIGKWNVGDTFGAVSMCRGFSGAQVTPFLASIEADDVIDDLIAYKSRVLMTQVVNVLPNFMLNTPRMKRKKKVVDVLYERVLESHTAAQRAGCPRDLADDVLSLHSSDPIFVPESNLSFTFSAPVLAGMYAGDELSFILHAMVSQPHLYEQIQAEADALFSNGDPSPDDLNSPAIDITRRFIMECLRLWPTVPMSIRTVMNACVVEDYELPVGSKVFIATTAPHYMSEIFPDPFTFDIDRYLPSRGEHRTPGYAPFGLGTHSCLGSHMVELQMLLSVLMLAHYFTLEISPSNYKLKISPFPSMSPNKRLKLKVVEQRHSLTS